MTTEKQSSEGEEGKCKCRVPLPGTRGVCMRCELPASPPYCECPMCEGAGAVREDIIKLWKRVT